MIKFHSQSNEVLIEGINKMDSAFLNWMIFFIVTIGCTVFHEMINGFWGGIKIFMISIFVMVIFRMVLRFQIRITKDTVTIKKLFLTIPYLRIKWGFEKVQEVSSSVIYFEKGAQKLEIENHEGFEVDCLLIVANESHFEFGNKEDAEIIFDHLLKGIQILNLLKAKIEK